jgi:hypothetical protein
MAIFQALFAWLSRSFGKVMNSAFAWATMLLFGKVSDNRQAVLSIISCASVVWLVTCVGVVYPRLGAFLLTLLPLPDWIDPQWIGRLMFVLVLVLPFINGIVSEFLDEHQDKNSSKRNWLSLAANGWRLTLALALTLVLMIVIAPIDRAMLIIKRWTVQHIPVVIEPQDYADVAKELHRVLAASGIISQKRKPTLLMQAPLWLLVALTGTMLKRLVADQLTKLVYADGELEIRPSDLIVRGKKSSVNRILALLITDFGFGKAYLSWTKEGYRIEDEMRVLWRMLEQNKLPRNVMLGRTDACLDEMRQLDLEKDEWETLYRLWLKLKVDMWQGIPNVEKKAS